MQMYSVRFRHHKTTVVDIGEVIVVASSQDTAIEHVIVWLELPRSSTSFEVNKMKPGIYQVLRGEIPKELPTNGTFPRSQKDLERLVEGERERYQVQIAADVWAHGEASAVKKLAKYALAETEGRTRPHAKAVGVVQIICERIDHSPRSPAVEQNAVYSHTRIFAGGDART